MLCPSSSEGSVYSMVDRDELIAIAKTYLDGILKCDGTAAALAPDCWRIEQGRNSGQNAEEIRASLKTMSYVEGIRDVRWYVDQGAEDVIAWYLLDVEGVTSFIAERFRIVDLLIREIEVVFAFAMGSKLVPWPQDETMVWPKNPDGSFQFS
jgi:hypothetical protein